MSVTTVSSCGIGVRMEQIKGKRKDEIWEEEDVVWGFYSINLTSQFANDIIEIPSGFQGENNFYFFQFIYFYLLTSFCSKCLLGL